MVTMRNTAFLAIIAILAALLMGCAGGADETPPVISSVLASNITETSVTITWTTDEPATSQVECGLTTSYGSATTMEVDLVTSHSVSLSGLDPDTTYHYRVKSRDGAGNERAWGDFTLTTAKPNEAPDRPSNVSPTDGATDVDLTPTLTSSAFSDPDAGDTHTASQWQITAASGDHSSSVYDSGTDGTNLTSVTISLGTLDNAITYYWRVRHQDSHDAWSSYSPEASFTTTTLIFHDENLEAAVREAIGKPYNPIHASDLEGLSSLDALGRNISDITGLEYCANLATLHLQSNQIRDITALENLTNLRNLYLSNNRISDISPLVNNEGLSEGDTINLAGNPLSAESLHALIPELEGRGVEVSHEEPQLMFPDPNLEAAIREAIGMPEGSINTSDLAELSTLHAEARGITSLAKLGYCTSLTKLYLSFNQISDISPLTGLTSLTELYLRYNERISDISPLSNLTSLKVLDLDSNPISDITPLSNLTSLTFLSLDGNQISDITPVTSLTGLRELWLEVNQISDITPLSNLTSLTELGLGANQISDITRLSNLTSLRVLRLGSNPISDITPLLNLTSLTEVLLGWNQIRDITPLVDNEGLSEGDRIDLRGNPLSAKSLNILIPQLETRGVVLLYDAS